MCGVVVVNNCCACITQQCIKRFLPFLSRIIQGMAEMKHTTTYRVNVLRYNSLDRVEFSEGDITTTTVY